MKNLKTAHIAIYTFFVVAIISLNAYCNGNIGHYMEIIISAIYLGLWWFFCNSRYYVLTRSRLKHLEKGEILEYMPYTEYDSESRTNIIKKIYVRPWSYKYFLEIDNIIGFPSKSFTSEGDSFYSLGQYRKFISENTNCEQLLNTMNYNAISKAYHQLYYDKKDRDNVLKFIGIFAFILGWLVYLGINVDTTPYSYYY